MFSFNKNYRGKYSYRRAGVGGMGDQLDPFARWLHPVLHQHRAHPRRRHPRGGLLGRDPQGHPRVRRIGEQQESRTDHPRRPPHRRLRALVDLHPRTFLRGPDQRPPFHRRSPALGGIGCARPLRQLVGLG